MFNPTKSNYDHFMGDSNKPKNVYAPPPIQNLKLEHSQIQMQHPSPNNHSEQHFDPLKIPCDWKIAEQHALSRRTATEKIKDPTKTTFIHTCPCCGFEIERDDIPYCSDPMALSFLGSGFTLFYNYQRYCIIILFIQIFVKQIYNIYTNYYGTYCEQKKQETFHGHIIEERFCPESWFLKLSFANKLNNGQQMEMTQILNLVGLIVIMIVLLIFRRSQRKIDTVIDEERLTPADYTICVKNIPISQHYDYQFELKNLFETCALKGDSEKPVIVRKVVLVYDIEEIIKLEKQLDELIEEKKSAIKENNFNYTHEKVLLVEQKIHQLQHQIHHLEEEYEKTNSKFTGIAFVSFEDESIKDEILKYNQHTTYERIQAHLNKGVIKDLPEEALSWNNQKLFLEQAPEPNDVDWEFIHIKTNEKICKRIGSWITYIIFESLTFLTIYFISHKVAKYGEDAHEKELHGEIDHNAKKLIDIFSFLIAFLIVVFNKFCVAKIIHYIVDDEKISSKTKFQISFVYKYALALFLNAAIISFLVDIVILKNIQGEGGFIQNESQIFILNALFPPFVWFVDPWSCCKNIWRKYLRNKGEKALLTQKEANILMEEPDYLSAKRYSDIMKTMWFTFLYGTAIPIGTCFSAIGILIYYYVDYYNILRRRTVKESISIQLSTEMIEMLEYIIFWSAFGGMIMTYSFFKTVTQWDLILIIVAIVYTQLPMEQISEFLFPVENEEIAQPYDVGSAQFDTDYDRENPITRNKAISEWNARQQHLNETEENKIRKQYQQQDQGGYQLGGHQYGRRDF